MTIRIIRTTYGEDILSTINEQNNLIQMTNPMRLVFRRLPTGQTMMLLSPWCPVELIEEDQAFIEKDNVLAIFNPRDKLIEYYRKMVEVSVMRKKEFEKVLDQYLQEEIDVESSEEESVTEEIPVEVLEALEEIKRTKLH